MSICQENKLVKLIILYVCKTRSLTKHRREEVRNDLHFRSQRCIKRYPDIEWAGFPFSRTAYNSSGVYVGLATLLSQLRLRNELGVASYFQHVMGKYDFDLRQPGANYRTCRQVAEVFYKRGGTQALHILTNAYLEMKPWLSDCCGCLHSCNSHFASSK